MAQLGKWAMTGGFANQVRQTVTAFPQTRWNQARFIHWLHLSTGESCGRVPVKSNPGKLRRPTILDAKSRELVPATSSVLSVVHQPALSDWNLREMMLAAWKLVVELEGPRRNRLGHPMAEPVKEEEPVKGGPARENVEGEENFDRQETADLKEEETEDEAEETELAVISALREGDQEKLTAKLKAQTSRQWELKWFLARANKLFSEKISEAPEKGRLFHQVLERHVKERMGKVNEISRWPQQFEPYRLLLDHWLDENVEEILFGRQTFACIYGFGGKCDAIFRLKDGTIAVCDFRTQLAKDGEIRTYRTWAAELAAHAVALGYPEARLLNICFGIGTSTVFEVKYWDGHEEVNLNAVIEEMEAGSRLFQVGHKGIPPTPKPHPEPEKREPAELVWRLKDVSEDQLFSEINKGYWEDFRLAFLTWCSPLAHSFQPHKLFASCKPIPTWEEILALGPERPLQLAVAKLQVIEPMKDDEEPNKK